MYRSDASPRPPRGLTLRCAEWEPGAGEEELFL
jgi:hypothetical protein